MIIINKQKFLVSLIAVNSKDKLHHFVIKKNGAYSLISEEKNIYFYLEENLSLDKISKQLEAFVKSNKYDLNVDMNSFITKHKNSEEIFQKVVETIIFASHKQISYKKEETKEVSYNFIVDEKFNSIFNNSVIKMQYLNFARDLQDLPPNIGTSVEIANRIAKKASEIEGIKVTVYDKKEIEKMQMGLLLAVNAGSYVDPRVVVLEYNSDPSQKRTALVGKGITFDSGGYNLKSSNVNQKFDMSGSAIVSSTVMALAKAKAKCNVISVALLTDNRIGGKATLTESVITSMNGQTVEITNTDAEGRLVLADGMTYAIRNEKADRLITVATLTGAIGVALGKLYTGIFSNNDDYYDEFSYAAKKVHESVWRLPINDQYLKEMQSSKIADFVNRAAGRDSGASNAASFLNAFCENKEYIHLDIAVTAHLEKRGRAPMFKTIFELLKK